MTISIDLETTSPESVAVEIDSPIADLNIGQDAPRVLLVAIPGPAGEPGAPGGGTVVVGEVPAGVKDGVNVVFTLAQTPRTGTTAVYRNGLRETNGAGYSVSGSTVTFTTPPPAGDEITADYILEG